MSGYPVESKVKPTLKWSINVGGNEEVSYQVPRSSNAALTLIEDQCCRVPTYGRPSKSDGQQQWAEKGAVEVAIFLASGSNNRIELTVHDPKENLSTCYQLEINDDVTKIELVALPPGTRDISAANEKEDSHQRAFGVLLTLATVEGISIFSLVFTNTGTTKNFVMSECLELSDFESTSPNFTLLKDRRVRELKSKVIFNPKQQSLGDKENRTKEEDLIQAPVLVVVASSLPALSRIPHATQKQTSSNNVDALFFFVRDHQCPMFQYRCMQSCSALGRQECSSLGLLRDVGKVMNVTFLGESLRDQSSGLIISILLENELKLVPIPTQGALKPNKLHVQTVLLSGICAHPSLAGMGEAVLVQSSDNGNGTDLNNHGSNTLAILCRPKINQIGFRTTPTITAMLSVRKTVSFSPVEVVNELSAGISRFFPAVANTPGAIPKEPIEPSEATDPFLISPDSDAPSVATPKERSQSTSVKDRSSKKLTEAIQTPLPESTNNLGAVSARNNVSMMSAATSSPLCGLKLLDRSSRMTERISLLDSGARQKLEVVDLTGKFSAARASTATLSPLSGLLLSDNDTSCDLLQVRPTASPQYKSFLTPVNIPKSDRGGRSALKSIQRTSRLQEEAQTDLNPDHLPHIIFVTVERAKPDAEKAKERTNMHCKVSISATAIPVSEVTFESASMKWRDSSGPSQKLHVAIHSKSSFRLAELSFLSGQEPSVQVKSMTTCSMGSLLEQFEKVNGKGLHKVKAISLRGNGATKGGSASGLEVRLLLCNQDGHSSSVTPNTPINMSSTEEAQLCLACAHLPQTLESQKSKTTGFDTKQDTSNDAIIEKLSEMMALMQRFEEKVDSGLTQMDRRIGVIEEALRTV